MIVEPDRDALRAALDRESRRLVDRVRSSAHLDAPAPGLVATLAALGVSESVVHGYDLAGALRTRPWLDERSAAAAAPTVMSAMLPLLVDPAGARGFTGSFEVRIRRSPRFVLRLDAGQARTAPAGGHKVDCVLSLSGCDALLVGFRRRKLWQAIAGGGALAHGRRPWLGLRFATLFRLP
jgi:hypothetical protein